jgi:hypothetical protein
MHRRETIGAYHCTMVKMKSTLVSATVSGRVNICV